MTEPCDTCPDGFLLPADMDPDDPAFADFLKNEFVELMTPSIQEYTIEVIVAVPIETGQAILDSARSIGTEHAVEEAQGYIDDLATTQTFFLDEIAASQRVLESSGYAVALNIRSSDS